MIIGIKYNSFRKRVKSSKEKINAPRQIGISNKKTKSTPSWSFTLFILDPNKVIPLLDIPGIIPMVWNSPIDKELEQFNFLSRFLNFLEIRISIPVIIKLIPIEKLFNNFSSILSLNSIPTIVAGKDPMMIYIPNKKERLSLSAFLKGYTQIPFIILNIFFR